MSKQIACQGQQFSSSPLPFFHAGLFQQMELGTKKKHFRYILTKFYGKSADNKDTFDSNLLKIRLNMLFENTVRHRTKMYRLIAPFHSAIS
jgi:hypothetical protein